MEAQRRWRVVIPAPVARNHLFVAQKYPVGLGLSDRYPHLSALNRIRQQTNHCVRIFLVQIVSMTDGYVIAVAKDGSHRFSKKVEAEINVVAGLGVDGDAHQGHTVKHRSRVAADPTQPNLRQIHLIHSELLDELKRKGFRVEPADLGENITTVGIDLLSLPRNARLAIGDTVQLEVTGLRNPCAQIERFQPGLLAAVLGRGLNGELIRKAGIMAVAIAGGIIRPDDLITVELPKPPFLPLERV